MTVLAVAAVSARMLAEAARGDGFDVLALDLFGDADTRRVCSEWFPIGRPGSPQLDAAMFLSALEVVAQRGSVAGWIAGSGFEGRPELLERGAALLPLIGTPASAVRRVRDPQAFFGFLDAEGIPHPAVRLTAPAEAAGWLTKDGNGCGGWHIRRMAPDHREPSPEADGARSPPAHRACCYFQREMAGVPMSATFIANGSDASVLGFNRLLVRRFGARPFVFCGAVGPLPLPDDVATRVTAAVRALAAGFSLRGLGSLDFMLDGETFGVLEVNPRPPASMALYGPRIPQAQAGQAPRGLVAAHVRACLQGELPSWTAQRADDAVTDPVQGTEIVFARRAIQLDELGARRLAARARCHDLPAAATHFEAGDPICSISACGASAEQVRVLLDRGREAVHQSLETDP